MEGGGNFCEGLVASFSKREETISLKAIRVFDDNDDDKEEEEGLYDK